MRKFLITPAFCKAALLRDFMRWIDETQKYEDSLHIVTDNHYPVDQENNSDAIRGICDRHSAYYIDSGADIGLHKSLNKAIEFFGIQSTSLLVGCDADDRPSPGAINSLFKVMEVDPTIGVLGLQFSVIRDRHAQGVLSEETVAGERVWRHPGLEMYNVAAFNMKMIHSMGGFHQPNQYYGGIEVALWPEMQKMGLHLAYLADHCSDAIAVDRSDPKLFDASYGDWKIAHATKGYKGSYGDWIKDSASGNP